HSTFATNLSQDQAKIGKRLEILEPASAQISLDLARITGTGNLQIPAFLFYIAAFQHNSYIIQNSINGI
ncbi:MAG TPA: hypothetical protein VK003_09415, partial [Oceanobacillus sp.]|nr:hypothetical protein [Oceanobacillus sp.]